MHPVTPRPHRPREDRSRGNLVIFLILGAAAPTAGQERAARFTATATGSGEGGGTARATTAKGRTDPGRDRAATTRPAADRERTRSEAGAAIRTGASEP